jgi:hypothetical protein
MRSAVDELLAAAPPVKSFAVAAPRGYRAPFLLYCAVYAVFRITPELAVRGVVRK